jgi:hypothetical protein
VPKGLPGRAAGYGGCWKNRLQGGSGVQRQARRHARAALLAAVALLLTACPVVIEPEAEPPEFEEDPTPDELADPEAEQLEVELVVVEGPGESTLAFVPVFIDDEGPFRFALDTGASDTAVHLPLAEDLGLEMGQVREITGVTGVGEAVDVEVTDWRLGDVPLPPSTVGGLPLPGAEDEMGFQGLLGSDILSTFGAITVDYEGGVLVLRDRGA